MATELKVPKDGAESISEVYIGEWNVKVGDFVEADAEVVEVETDKASQPVYSPSAGVITEILKEYGDTAEPGETIAMLDESAAPTGSKPSGDGSAGQSKGSSNNDKPETPSKVVDTPPESETSDPDRVMPAAQRLLKQHDLDSEDVVASGPGGRLLKEDVQKHLEATASQPTSPVIRHDEVGAPTPVSEEKVRMSPMRQRIASRLVSAQQTAALLTTFNEVDMSHIMGLRKQYQEQFVKKYDTKLGFMSFFVKAVIDALKQCPELNAEIQERDIVYKNYYDIGIAVGSGKGLVVPVLRDADRLSFAETELTIKDFARRAQGNQLNVDELTGGTFTISNGGVYGSLLSTPIVNPPQSGVLGMHSIQERPIAVDGQVVIRPMMYLALTYDHRIVDGKEAVTFLLHIKQILEDPTRLLLEV